MVVGLAGVWTLHSLCFVAWNWRRQEGNPAHVTNPARAFAQFVRALLRSASLQGLQEACRLFCKGCIATAKGEGIVGTRKPGLSFLSRLSCPRDHLAVLCPESIAVQAQDQEIFKHCMQHFGMSNTPHLGQLWSPAWVVLSGMICQLRFGWYREVGMIAAHAQTGGRR